MTTRILISIVTHNSGEVIAECIGQLADIQNAEDLDAQIIVADNASEDRTVDIVRDIQKTLPDLPLTLVPSPSNLGWGAGNNLAIGAGRWTPDYVLLCNPDAGIDEKNLRALVRGLREQEPRAAIAVPYLEGPDGTILGANPEWRLAACFYDLTAGKHRFERFQARYRPPRGTFEVPRAYASGALALVSFSALREAGFFDERIFLFHDDIDVTRRILAKGHTLIGVGEALGHHLGGRGSVISATAPEGSSVASLAYESELVFVEKWYGPVWAWLLAAYRCHAFFQLVNILRRTAGRRPIDIDPLRAPACKYLAKRGQASERPT